MGLKKMLRTLHKYKRRAKRLQFLIHVRQVDRSSKLRRIQRINRYLRRKIRKAQLRTLKRILNRLRLIREKKTEPKSASETVLLRAKGLKLIKEKLMLEDGVKENYEKLLLKETCPKRKPKYCTIKKKHKRRRKAKNKQMKLEMPDISTENKDLRKSREEKTEPQDNDTLRSSSQRSKTDEDKDEDMNKNKNARSLIDKQQINKEDTADVHEQRTSSVSRQREENGNSSKDKSRNEDILANKTIERKLKSKKVRRLRKDGKKSSIGNRNTDKKKSEMTAKNESTKTTNDAMTLRDQTRGEKITTVTKHDDTKRKPIKFAETVKAKKLNYECQNRIADIANTGECDKKNAVPDSAISKPTRLDGKGKTNAKQIEKIIVFKKHADQVNDEKKTPGTDKAMKRKLDETKLRETRMERKLKTSAQFEKPADDKTFVEPPKKNNAGKYFDEGIRGRTTLFGSQVIRSTKPVESNEQLKAKQKKQTTVDSKKKTARSAKAVIRAADSQNLSERRNKKKIDAIMNMLNSTNMEEGKRMRKLPRRLTMQEIINANRFDKKCTEQRDQFFTGSNGNAKIGVKKKQTARSKIGKKMLNNDADTENIDSVNYVRDQRLSYNITKAKETAREGRKSIIKTQIDKIINAIKERDGSNEKTEQFDSKPKQRGKRPSILKQSPNVAADNSIWVSEKNQEHFPASVSNSESSKSADRNSRFDSRNIKSKSNSIQSKASLMHESELYAILRTLKTATAESDPQLSAAWKSLSKMSSTPIGDHFVGRFLDKVPAESVQEQWMEKIALLKEQQIAMFKKKEEINELLKTKGKKETTTERSKSGRPNSLTLKPKKQSVPSKKNSMRRSIQWQGSKLKSSLSSLVDSIKSLRSLRDTRHMKLTSALADANRKNTGKRFKRSVSYDYRVSVGSSEISFLRDRTGLIRDTKPATPLKSNDFIDNAIALSLQRIRAKSVDRAERTDQLDDKNNEEIDPLADKITKTTLDEKLPDNLQLKTQQEITLQDDPRLFKFLTEENKRKHGNCIERSRQRMRTPDGRFLMYRLMLSNLNATGRLSLYQNYQRHTIKWPNSAITLPPPTTAPPPTRVTSLVRLQNLEK